MARLINDNWHNGHYRVVKSDNARGYEIADCDKARYESDKDRNETIPILISLFGIIFLVACTIFTHH